jgi:hypothetical protein
MGAKGQPGEKVDCSGLVAESVTAGGEKNPNHGSESSGVLNIEDNTTKVKDKDATAGNVVTFHFDGDGYAYHTGLVTGVTKDKDGNIVSFTMIQSSSGVGPNEKTVTIGEGKLGENVNGFYKWDTKPDEKSDTNPAANSNAQPAAASSKIPSSSGYIPGNMFSVLQGLKIF